MLIKLWKLLSNKQGWLSSADAEGRAGDLALPFDTLKSLSSFKRLVAKFDFSNFLVNF